MARSKRTPTGRTRGLLVRIEDTHDYDGPAFRVLGVVVTAVVADGAATEVKNVGHLFDYEGHLEKSDSRHRLDDNDLADFEISGRAQLDRYNDGAPRTWGCWATFSHSLIDTMVAKRMVRVLGHVDRALADRPDYNHKPGGLGAWFADAAAAVGAEVIVFPTREGSHYAQGEYVALDPAAASTRIETAYAAWVARVAPQHAAATS